jgi:uncharacterized protein YjiS (DUF1127 family)
VRSPRFIFTKEKTMTTIDLTSTDITATRSSLFAPFRKFLAAMKQRRAERRTLIELSRMDARTLRDIGIEPMDVHDAFMGRRLSILFYPQRPADHE